MRNSYYLNKESKIDKLENIIKANCWFVYDQLKNNQPETLFYIFFSLYTLLHKNNTQTYFAKHKGPQLGYGSNFNTLKVIKQWNEIQNFIKIVYILPKGPILNF